MSELKEKCKKRLSRWFKLRFAIFYPFCAWAIIVCHSTDESMLIGLWVIGLGIGIRSWANCYAIKMDKLTTSGPYAYTRHPLYFGSFLILCGFLIMLNINWLGIAAVLLIVVGGVYTNTIRKEENMLNEKFGQEYNEYKKAVPTFFPTIIPFKGGEKWGPSLKRYFKSQEYKVVIWIIIITILFHLKEEIIIEKENIDSKMILLVIFSLFLGLTDLVAEIAQKRMKKADKND